MATSVSYPRRGLQNLGDCADDGAIFRDLKRNRKGSRLPFLYQSLMRDLQRGRVEAGVGGIPRPFDQAVADQAGEGFVDGKVHLQVIPLAEKVLAHLVQLCLHIHVHGEASTAKSCLKNRQATISTML
jgi:hypothetical protein